MKQLLICSAFTAIATFSHASDYKCTIIPNEDRGFHHSFEVTVSPSEKTGVITISTGGDNVETVGEVQQEFLIPKVSRAFQVVANLIAASDVSGIASVDVAKVDSVQVFRTVVPKTGKLSIFRFMASDQQIGGTVVFLGLANTCMPTKTPKMSEF
jgi:hypothetical protein